MLLLKAPPEAFEALCAALRERASVGECCVALEEAFAENAESADLQEQQCCPQQCVPDPQPQCS